MPRLPRIDYPGSFHHVIARGIERRKIFKRRFDYEDFVERLSAIIEETKTPCYAWALMPNHIHLLLQTGPRPIAHVMQRLLTGYAVSFNLRYKRAGHLFQNRYKDILCQEDAYLLELVRYIALNPVRAGLIADLPGLSTYPWNGHSALLGKHSRKWQAIDPVLQRFGPTLALARMAYETFVASAWDQKKQDHLEGGGLIRSAGSASKALRGVQASESCAYDPRILGDSDFVTQALLQATHNETEHEALKTLCLADIVNEICDATGEDPTRLTRKGQSRSLTAAKALAIFAGVTWINRSLRDMSEMLAMSSSAGSRAFERGRLLAEECQLGERLQAQSCSYVP